MKPKPNLNYCTEGHREIWYDHAAPCPLCELARYIEIVAKRLADAKAMMDHLSSLCEKRAML